MTKPFFVEEIKVAQGQYFNLEGHAIRMDRTIRHFFRKPFFQAALPKSLPEPPHKGLHKCILLYDENIVSTTFEPFTLPTIKSLALVNAPGIDFIYKSQNKDPLLKILEFSKADEAIIVRNTFVTNATSANLVFEDEEGALWTPLHYIHSGTKREFYLKRKMITTYPIKASSIRSFTRVILINALIDLEDDVSFNCQDILPIVDYEENKAKEE
jgi:4-amino-4-deoxychorismate lyase